MFTKGNLMLILAVIVAVLATDWFVKPWLGPKIAQSSPTV